MKRWVVVGMIGLFLSSAHLGRADVSWRFEYFLGSVYNFRLPLVIHQSGYEDIRLNADYATKPWEIPLYWVVRVSRWTKHRGWELEFVHHKLYLTNNPPEIDAFTITHGYNIFTVNRAWDYRGFTIRLGAGGVVTHPENTIRGKKHPENQGLFSKGHYLSGPVIQAALEKKVCLWRRLFFAAEGKLTGSYVRIPVEGGHANVWNVAIHGLFGLGYAF